MRRTLLRPLVVGGVALAATLSATPAALADSSRCTADAACAGKASFKSLGEVFTLTDQVGDGHSAVLLYWLPDGTGPHLVWNPNGKGTSVTANLELGEGSWVHYRVCLGEHGSKDVLENTCGAPITDRA
ncbi:MULTISPECIES: hypothetical protein [unclassified Crossiella]|uniref:hypothetical protein n=1 Tax=unclassified Crossiella TaxID=2620835 RepID=UPI001FFFB423|nr:MULTISPECIES: hypothetical protein [unclassified Crossiella]MCK2238716.1 hypothetical protein [Crossiella sp. S99.2]MCK2251714.1 hypothetical protein [Crossiella sp. S99.1]